MPSSKLRRTFRWSVVSLCGSFAASAAAGYWYSLPNLLGFSGQDVYGEKDFWFAMVAGALAFAAGGLALHAARSTSTATGGGLIAGLILWIGLTLLLLVCWWSFVLYYALWLAPNQALGLLGVSWCFRLLDRERTAQRLALKQGDE